MDWIKRAIVICASLAILLVLSVVGLALYGFVRKEQNRERIKPAAQNRWPKLKKVDDESPERAEMDTSPSNGRASDLGSDLGMEERTGVN